MDPTIEQQFGMRYASLDDLLASSTIVSLHLPLTEATRGLIGEAELAWRISARPDPYAISLLIPTATVPQEEQLAGYRRIREALSTRLALEFRSPGRMLAAVPQHK